MSRIQRACLERNGPRFTRILLTIAIAAASCAVSAQETQDLGQVVVTASGFEQSVKDAPAAITVITQDELKKKSYTDVTDALKNVAGVQISGGGVEQSIMIRGMAAGYTLFLIDGRPAQGNDAFSERGSQAGNPVNFLPPLEAIERIEVIRGPASALYGSDAMGGVVNIITKKVHNEWSGSITAEYAMAGSGNDVNEDGYQTNAVLNMPLIEDVLGLQLIGAFQNQDESHLVGLSDSAATDPEYKKRHAGGKLSWNINSANTLTLGHSYTQQERWKYPGRSLLETDDPTYTDSVKKNYFLTHEGHYGNVVTNSYINHDHSDNRTTLNANTGKGIEYNVTTVNTQASWFLGSHTLTGGLTYKYENLEQGNNGLPANVVDPDKLIKMNRYQNSIFLEDSWGITDDFTLTLSGRLDDNQAFGSHFSPKVYGVWHLTDSFTLKGGVTSGYKAPDLRQSATDFGMTSRGGVAIGNPDLKPEKSLNRELGIHYENRELGLAGSLTGYVTDFKDKINRTPRVCLQNQDPCIYNGTQYAPHQYGYTAYENIDKARLSGIEFTLDYNILDNLVYRHSYTYTKTEQRSGELKGKPLNDIAKHMFNASLDWQATRQLNLWVQGNYRGKTSGRWATGSAGGANTTGKQYAGYTFMDVGLVFKPKDDLSLKAGLYNALNKEVTTDGDYAYNLDGRKLIFALTKSF